VQAVPGWPIAFRGSLAVAAGLVTRRVLAGPRFVRVLPDTYVPAGVDRDLRLRSHAAFRYVQGRGVLAGYSAAELLSASCGPRDAPAEVVVWPGSQRAHPGLLVRREPIDAADVVEIGGIRLTSPRRTAFDLARRGPLVERVVAVDALANAHGFDPDVLRELAEVHVGARGSRDLATVLGHADRRAGSPMETRLRMLIVTAGLPAPQVQWVVQDEAARTAVWLDLAYPEQRIGIEYDGAVHADRGAVLRDIGRHTRLLDRGWRVYRYTKRDVLGCPERIVAELDRALHRARWT